MEFNPKFETESIVNFIRKYYEECNLKGVVIGISGGKDSGVVAALFSKAIGPENIIGITMPCKSKLEDREDAMLVSKKYGFELIDVNLDSTYTSFNEEIKKLGNFSDDELANSNINIKPRLRMTTLYYIAALYSKLKNGTYVVAGTGNKSELYVGYYTKGGDSTYDIGVLNEYTVDEVIKIGEYLEVPEKVLYKTPSDGLSEKSDEEKMGIKYKDIEKYLNNEELDENIKEKIKMLHKNNLHKANVPVYRR